MRTYLGKPKKYSLNGRDIFFLQILVNFLASLRLNMKWFPPRLSSARKWRSGGIREAVQQKLKYILSGHVCSLEPPPPLSLFLFFFTLCLLVETEIEISSFILLFLFLFLSFLFFCLLYFLKILDFVKVWEGVRGSCPLLSWQRLHYFVNSCSGFRLKIFSYI